MAGPLAVGQQVLYERVVARAGPVVRVGHPNGIGPACVVGLAGATGIAGLLAGNNLIIILLARCCSDCTGGLLLL